MKKNLFAFTTILLVTNAFAVSNKMIECRLVTNKTTECKAYATKFIFTELSYRHDEDSLKLITAKTLPVPEKKSIKVITVEDMIEKHIEVLDPVRYRAGPSMMPVVVVSKESDVNLSMMTQDEKEQERLRSIKEAEDQKREREVQLKKYPKYKVRAGDSLILIAKRFDLSTDDILEWNDIEDKETINLGQKLTLPLSYYRYTLMMNAYEKMKQKEEREARKIEKAKKLKEETILHKRILLGNKLYPSKDSQLKYSLDTKKSSRSLRVQATAYSSHGKQTDATPFLAAWNNRIRPGMNIIAVSRDLISKYGLTNGSRVRISGLHGYYTVRDKMNSRFSRRIDIYMGVDRRRALRWGRRSVTIFW